MQNAKDTFYEVLRDRVAAGNAERRVVIRGTLRPAVVVDENELVEAATLLDCFRMRWTTVRVGADGIAELGCEVTYATEGAGGGMDRGRRLAALDEELTAAMNAQPQNAAKKDFHALATGGAAEVTGSRIWWSDVSFAKAEADGNELRRTATVQVWAFEEAGDA